MSLLRRCFSFKFWNKICLQMLKGNACLLLHVGFALALVFLGRSPEGTPELQTDLVHQSVIQLIHLPIQGVRDLEPDLPVNPVQAGILLVKALIDRLT